MKYLLADRDRHGNPRLYWRAPGPDGRMRKIRLFVAPGHPEFDLAVAAAKQGRKWIPGVGAEAERPRGPQEGTLAALVQDFYAAPAFLARLDETTRRKRRAILDGCCAETVRVGAPDLMGDCPLRYFGRDHVARLIALKAAAPEAAEGRRKALRRLFNWAVAEGRVAANPVTGVDKQSAPTDGHHTWAIEEIARYWARWPVGTKARLALDLLIFTGLRISDLAQVGAPHLRGETISKPQHKNRRRTRRMLEFPIHPALRASLDACPSRGLTFLETDFGRPYSIKGLGNKLRAWCDAAGLPHCSAHGVRKAAATILADNGATDFMLMSLFGWSDIRQAQTYTKAANRRRLAGDAVRLISIEIVPPESIMEKGETKTA